MSGCGSFPKEGDPNVDPKNIVILIMGIPKKVPLILGNPKSQIVVSTFFSVIPT